MRFLEAKLCKFFFLILEQFYLRSQISSNRPLNSDEVYSCSSIAPLESPKFAGQHHQTLDSYTIVFSIFPKLEQFYSSRIILLFWNICVICTKPYNLQP